MKTNNMKRGFSVPIIIVICLALIIIAVMILSPDDKAKDNTNTPTTSSAQITANEIPSITQSDIDQGWYYGDVNQKKSGTPATWILRYSGTRNAQWYDPSQY